MSCTQRHHRELIDGMGKCAAPMWMDGYPHGFCDELAYGFRLKCKEYRDGWTGRWKRWDGKYNGYLPGLACTVHGGPALKEVAHINDPCDYCGVPHDEVAVGPCPARVDELKEALDGLR